MKKQKKAVDSGKDIAVENIYMCPVCGYITFEEEAQCPICGCKASAFIAY